MTKQTDMVTCVTITLVKVKSVSDILQPVFSLAALLIVPPNKRLLSGRLAPRHSPFINNKLRCYSGALSRARIRSCRRVVHRDSMDGHYILNSSSSAFTMKGIFTALINFIYRQIEAAHGKQQTLLLFYGMGFCAHVKKEYLRHLMCVNLLAARYPGAQFVK